MKISTFIQFFCALLFSAIASAEPAIGMEKGEYLALYSQNIIRRDKTGGITARMQYWGHEAEVYSSFYQSDNIKRMEVLFTPALPASERDNRLTLFRDIKRRLALLSGQSLDYARIDGIDLLGYENVLEKSAKNVILYCMNSEGLVYQVEIVSEKIEDIAKSGVVRLQIHEAKATQIPTVKN